MRQQSKKQNQNAKVKIIPLGGLEQIGMNITAIEYEDSIIVIDCGLAFPSDDMLGIDLCIPDITYLKENIEKVKGFVSAIEKFDGYFDMATGRYVVDAKSIMGIFSMDLSKKVEFRILETDAQISEVEAAIAPYIA